MKRALTVMVAATVLLAGCGAQEGPTLTPPSVGAAPAAAVSVAPPSPSRVDPGLSGCRRGQSLGAGSGPADYDSVAAEVAGTGDAALADAAVQLHRQIGEGRSRTVVYSAWLDLLEECLRVTG